MACHKIDVGELSHVLLTGATGFLGSVVLERLLSKVPTLWRITVIVRDKKGLTASARIQRLLGHSDLFGVWRKSEPNAECLDVRVGDTTLPFCGLSTHACADLTQSVTHVIHCAASIAFDEPMHESLRQNYEATQNVAAFAQKCPKLQRFVHVSTAYVNSYMPKGTLVQECVSPLVGKCSGVIDHKAIAHELSSLSPCAADRQGAFYVNDVGLPNNYTFTKNLAEQLMLDLHTENFPVSIVRPTIVSCLNGTPAPGYFGNTSGAIAFVMAFATGMAHHTCHDQDHHVQDVIPCDLVASVIIASAAIKHSINFDSHPSVFHVASSTKHGEPVANQFRRIFLPYWTQRPPPFTLYTRPYQNMWKKGFYSPEQSLTFRLRNFRQAVHIGVLAIALQASGRKQIAKLVKKQWKTWKLYNVEAMDFNLFFSVDNTAALHGSMPEIYKSDFKMLWQPPTDSWDDYYRLVFDAIHCKIFQNANSKGVDVLDQAKHAETLCSSDRCRTPSS